MADQRCFRRAGAHNGRCFAFHGAEEAVQIVEAEAAEALVATAYDLEGNGCPQESDRRADTGTGRHDHPVNAETLRETRSVERSRAAEGDHRAPAHHLAPLDRVYARGIGHAFVDDLADGEGGKRALHAHRFSDRGIYRGRRLLRLEPDLAAREPRRVDTLHDDVGIRHGWVLAATAVTGGSRFGAGTVRPHRDTVEAINTRDRTAARADLHHLDDRNTQRKTAAFQIAEFPRDFEIA